MLWRNCKPTESSKEARGVFRAVPDADSGQEGIRSGAIGEGAKRGLLVGWGVDGQARVVPRHGEGGDVQVGEVPSGDLRRGRGQTACT